MQKWLLIAGIALTGLTHGVDGEYITLRIGSSTPEQTETWIPENVVPSEQTWPPEDQKYLAPMGFHWPVHPREEAEGGEANIKRLRIYAICHFLEQGSPLKEAVDKYCQDERPLAFGFMYLADDFIRCGSAEGDPEKRNFDTQICELLESTDPNAQESAISLVGALYKSILVRKAVERRDSRNWL